MIERVTTITGSVYELDLVGGRVRRLEGTHDPTPRQGEDGEWKHFEAFNKLGDRMFFDWDGEGHGTLTSPVVSVEKVTATEHCDEKAYVDELRIRLIHAGKREDEVDFLPHVRALLDKYPKEGA